jgi:hypothetical protein
LILFLLVFSLNDVIATDDLLSNVETGTVQVNHNWLRVDFQNSFSDPVVIADAVTNNEADPSHIRLRSVDSTGFEIRIEEWNYLDGIHDFEIVNYLVLEEGVYETDNGTIEVGKSNTTHVFKETMFETNFEEIPIVVAQSQTFNGGHEIITRMKNIDVNSFEVKVQEEEIRVKTGKGGHKFEDIGYIAASPGIYENTLFFAKTDNVVTNNWWTVDYIYDNIPYFFASSQSYDGSQTAGLRYSIVDENSATFKMEEEQSWDSEVKHTTEVVGYLIYGELPIEPINFRISLMQEVGTKSSETAFRVANENGTEIFTIFDVRNDGSENFAFINTTITKFPDVDNAESILVDSYEWFVDGVGVGSVDINVPFLSVPRELTFSEILDLGSHSVYLKVFDSAGTEYRSNVAIVNVEMFDGFEDTNFNVILEDFASHLVAPKVRVEYVGSQVEQFYDKTLWITMKFPELEIGDADDMFFPLESGPMSMSEVHNFITTQGGISSYNSPFDGMDALFEILPDGWLSYTYELKFAINEGSIVQEDAETVYETTGTIDFN